MGVGSLEEIPVIQKMIIKKAYNAGKQVITATQMLGLWSTHRPQGWGYMWRTPFTTHQRRTLGRDRWQIPVEAVATMRMEKSGERHKLLQAF